MSQFRLCCHAADLSSCFSTGNLAFSRMNLEATVLKNSVFDWTPCFFLYEVYRFQNLVGLEFSIKHTPVGDGQFSWGIISTLAKQCIQIYLWAYCTKDYNVFLGFRKSIRGTGNKGRGRENAWEYFRLSTSLLHYE